MALNPKLRRAVRARGHFRSDDAATKLLYLILNRSEKEWKMPPREWTMAKAQFAVIFGERFIRAMAAMFNSPPAHGIPDSPRASQLPQRILQMLGQSGEALSTQYDRRILPAAAGEAKMKEAMVEALAGDGDTQIVSDGEIQEA
ncbi:hypothetical protein ACVILI_006622 [Mesorhizobium sp. USDA 4775]